MEPDPFAKLKERERALRAARDEILARVEAWLGLRNFKRAGAGHFTRPEHGLLCHIGFQKHRNGRAVRVMCYVTRDVDTQPSAIGPTSDAYERPGSPNGKKYNFAWSTRANDIARCVDEYCKYLDDVVLGWFSEFTKNKQS